MVRLEATSRKIAESEKRKIPMVMRGHGMELAMLILVMWMISDDGGVLVATHDYKGSDEWIVNSGCSFHMTPNKSFFSTY